MRWRTLDEINRTALLELVDNQVCEDRHLEYKEELPGSSDEDKREFLADVSAFANGGGGDLLYGVREKRDASGVKLGIAGEITGISGLQLEPARARIESMIRDGVAPRIPGIGVLVVDGFAGGPVLVLRVPRSWSAPHMVTFKGASKFYMRAGGGKHQLDVHELRHAFMSNRTALSAAREFRLERIGRTIAGETPLRLRSGTARWILHLVPGTLDTVPALDLLEHRGHEIVPRPEYVQGWNTRWTLDGYVAYSSTADAGRAAFWYAQIFRNGCIESVDALSPADSLFAGTLEKSLFVFAERAMRASKALGVDGPWFLMATLAGVRAHRLRVSTHSDISHDLDQNTRAFDRDPVLLPEVEVGGSTALPAALQPLCDALWQSSGWPRSAHFDSAGAWKPPR